LPRISVQLNYNPPLLPEFHYVLFEFSLTFSHLEYG
jgi:hypothetical protein